MYTHIYRSYKITNQAPRLTESVLIQNNSGLDDAASWMTGHSRSSRQIWNLVLVVLDHLRWASIWQGFLAHRSQAWENGSASKMWMPNSYLRAPNVWNRYDPRLLDWWNVLHHSCDFFSICLSESMLPKSHSGAKICILENVMGFKTVAERVAQFISKNMPG